MKILKTLLLWILTTTTFAQTKNWTKDERANYTTMKSLCEYFKGKAYDTTQRDLVFKQFVYFDNILADTSKARIQERIGKFDTLFYRMIHFVDSVGLDHLDAQPTRYFADNEALFKPFDKKDGQLSELLPLTLTYFDKRKPNQPIGTLLFEPETHKLLAWIIINQGGYYYFLTFNLA